MSAPSASASASVFGAIVNLLRRLGLVLIIVVAAFSVKFVLMSLLGMQDDAHILNILKFKLSGFSKAYEDFQTLLYVCSGAYQIMQWPDVEFLQEQEALPQRGLVVLGAVAVLAVLELHKPPPPPQQQQPLLRPGCSSSSSSRNNNNNRVLDPALVFAAAHGLLLVGLFTLIQRLSSVGVPFVCVFVAQAASPNHLLSIFDVAVSCCRTRSGEVSDADVEGTVGESAASSPSSSSSSFSGGLVAGKDTRSAAPPTSNKMGEANKKNKKNKKTQGFSLLRLAVGGLGLAVAGWSVKQAYASLQNANTIIVPKMIPPRQPRISNDMQVGLLLLPDRTGAVRCRILGHP